MVPEHNINFESIQDVLAYLLFGFDCVSDVDVFHEPESFALRYCISTFPVVEFMASWTYFSCPYFLNNLRSCGSDIDKGKFPTYNRQLRFDGAAAYGYSSF